VSRVSGSTLQTVNLPTPPSKSLARPNRINSPQHPSWAGGDDKAATAKQCRVASGEEVAKGTSIDVHPNDSAADEEVDYSQLSPDHPLYALAGKVST
jgi:hypothetical protein